MGIGKQAKVLTPNQIKAISLYLKKGRHGLRNQTVFLLSVKSGLRAKEIAMLTWSMVLAADRSISSSIHLPNKSSKGKSGRVIPLHSEIKENFVSLLGDYANDSSFDPLKTRIIQTQRSNSTSPQAIVNMFQNWYKQLSLVGCSSHSGRRTFITQTARKIHLVGGSLRDVQIMAGHASLQTTQRYIEADSACQQKVVSML